MPKNEFDTVNNYQYGLYQEGEVWIQTEPDQMRANSGMVYLTQGELNKLLNLIRENLEG